MLENSYLCGSNNNSYGIDLLPHHVVICLKIRTFAVATTTKQMIMEMESSCDLLENSYLCGSNNNEVEKPAMDEWL